MTYRFRHPEIQQEEDILPSGQVVAALVGVLLVAGVLVLVSISLVDGREASIRPFREFPERDLGPRHAVQAVLQRLFDEPPLSSTFTARQERALESYAWVDQERRIVRIPIERAMELVAQGRRP